MPFKKGVVLKLVAFNGTDKACLVPRTIVMKAKKLFATYVGVFAAG